MRPLLFHTRVLPTIAAITLLFAGCGRSEAAETTPALPSPTMPGADLTDVGEFADSYFPTSMDRYHVPGAVIVVVKGDQIILARGYGLADWERKIPVDVESTRFRIASISKLFTATAVMQLVERGEISLNEDVRIYLPSFPLSTRYPGPVTPAHLLSHTGGFDDYYVGMITLTRDKVVPLSEYLAARMPEQSVPPGKMVIYSNHAYSLLGYLVEVVSGVPFARYVDEQILAPLKMSHSGFEIDPKDVSDMAVGSEFRKGELRNTPHYYFNTGPASSLIATGPDMAHFMIAHLNGGALEGNRILSSETIDLMHEIRFRHDGRIAGYCLGFVEHRENGRRAIWHAGEFQGYSSLLYLLPEDQVGVFISYNSADRQLHEQFIHGFLDRYYLPAAEPTYEEPEDAEYGDTNAYIGAYRPNPYSRHSYTKLAALLSQLNVTGGEDGTLRLSGNVRPNFFGTGDGIWIPVGTNLFKQEDDERLIAFRQDERGDVTHLFYESSALEKLAFWEASRFHFAAIGLFNTVFLIGFLALPLGAMARRLKGTGRGGPHMPRWGRRITAAVCLLNLVFLVGVLMVLALVEPWRFTLGTPPILRALFVIPFITVPGSLGVVAFTAAAWAKSEGTAARRLWYTGVSLVLAAYVPFLLYWNLLGLRY